MKRHYGFTLIEQIIVVTIIGILTLFALLTYQTYIKRTYVIEGLLLTAPHKEAVLSTFSDSGELLPAVLPQGVIIGAEHALDANYSVGLEPPSSYASMTIKQIFVAPGSKIVVQFNEKVIDGGTLILFPNVSEGSIKWSCGGNISGDSGVFLFVEIPDRYLPVGCRDKLNFGD